MIAILGVPYWIWRQRSRAAQNSISAHETYTKPELDASNSNFAFHPQRHELEAISKIYGMPLTNSPVELPVD
jgi:hypothetical protein